MINGKVLLVEDSPTMWRIIMNTLNHIGITDVIEMVLIRYKTMFCIMNVLQFQGITNSCATSAKSKND